MFAYCINNPSSYKDYQGFFAIPASIYSPVPFEQETSYANILEANSQKKSTNPKDSPPDHPDYKKPKQGDSKKRNPNGKGWGWVDAEGNVWVWTPGMHGGAGWTIQKPDGGHTHAYPGGGTRSHFEALPSHAELNIFPALDPNFNNGYVPLLIPVVIVAGIAVISELMEVSIGE